MTDFGVPRQASWRPLDFHDIREWDVLLSYWNVFLLRWHSCRWEGDNRQAFTHGHPKRAGEYAEEKGRVNCVRGPDN